MSTKEEALKKARSPEESIKEQGDLLRQMVEEAVRKVLNGAPPSPGEGGAPLASGPLQTTGQEPGNGVPAVSTVEEEDTIAWNKGIYPIAVTIKKKAATGGKGAVLFASSLSGEGTSTVCSRVSKALAKICSGNILLLDGNIRNPSIHKFFNTQPVPGLLDILTGKLRWVEAVKKSEQVNHFFLPVGESVSNPLFWLGSERMGDLLALLRTDFEFILLDAPPFWKARKRSFFYPG